MITLIGIISILGLTVIWLQRKTADMYRSSAEGLICIVGLGMCFLLPAVAFVGINLEGLGSGYGEGTRVGFVTKVSQKGIVFKTHEGQLQLGVGQQASLQKPFYFSVCDEAVIKDLNTALTSGQRVRLNYREWLVQPWARGSTSYEILSVEFIE